MHLDDDDGWEPRGVRDHVLRLWSFRFPKEDEPKQDATNEQARVAAVPAFRRMRSGWVFHPPPNPIHSKETGRDRIPAKPLFDPDFPHSRSVLLVHGRRSVGKTRKSKTDLVVLDRRAPSNFGGDTIFYGVELIFATARFSWVLWTVYAGLYAHELPIKWNMNYQRVAAMENGLKKENFCSENKEGKSIINGLSVGV